jgi:hypothetical protein
MAMPTARGMLGSERGARVESSAETGSGHSNGTAGEAVTVTPKERAPA